jgi:hypothetical protein
MEKGVLMKRALAYGLMAATSCVTLVVGQKDALNADGTVASADAKKKNVTCVKENSLGSHLPTERCFSNDKNVADEQYNRARLNDVRDPSGVSR